MSGADLARKILRNFTYGGSDNSGVRKDYVEHLTNKSLAFLRSYERGFGLLSEHEIVRDATLRLVEKTFNLLEPYVVHFNNSIATSALRIASTPPDEIIETVEGEWPFRPAHEVSFYRARFSTHKLSLIIRGSEDRIEFFLLPVDQLMSLSKIEDDFGSLMTFNSLIEGNKVSWIVEGKPLTDERFERYCLLTFDFFIKQSQDELVRAS